MAKFLLEDMVIAKRAKKETIIKEPKKIPKESKKIERPQQIQKIERSEVTEVREEKIYRASPVGLQPREDKKITPSSVKNRSRWMLWVVALISVVFCFFAISFLFAKAEVTVNPKTKDVALNENMSAGNDSNIDGLSFNLVVIDGMESKTLQATGEKDIAEKATGTVVIFNALNSASQRLDVDTRLEGSNGKIYKTQAKSVVPGVNKDGTPGSVEVKIYGSEAGAEYNSPPLDFKIIGFKGTSKYEKFYGRSKGDISGGFVGKGPVIAEADKAAAISELRSTLQEKLLKKASAPGFVLFKNAVFLNADDSNVSLVYNTDNSVTLTLKGILYGFLFDEQKLTKKIAKDNIEKYDGSVVYIPNLKDLNFTLINKDGTSFNNIKVLNFNLTGPVKIIWKLDEAKFRASLLGKSKADFKQILSKYPNIDSADLVLTPMWRTSIPSKSEDIKVNVNYPN